MERKRGIIKGVRKLLGLKDVFIIFNFGNNFTGI